MNRLKLFNKLPEHPMYIYWWSKLTADEIKLCQQFILDNDCLDKNEFAFKLNRWYLDDPNKPENLTNMWALLTEVNSM